MEAKKIIDLSGLSSTDKGDIVEDRIKELILLYGKGQLNVYKPVTDTEGLDLVIVKKGTFKTIFLQVKSRFTLHRENTFITNIQSKTFNPHHTFFIVCAYFNPKTLEIHENLLLVPSEKIRKMCKPRETRGRWYYRIVSSIRDSYTGKWKGYMVKKTELANKLLEKFEEMNRYVR